MITSKIFGITLGLASALAVTSSAMAVEKYDRMQSERSFSDNGAGVGAYANAYASAQYTVHPARRLKSDRMHAAWGLATTRSEQRAIDRLSERQS
jgi:hypothetical protein